ncbi:MAG: hypothetical protein IPM63_02550 [Acidobacteriota bacterium]|nr:MAG: hypothetical protein IPM63_02550 [Acidobacteriota bacterium]
MRTTFLLTLLLAFQAVAFAQTANEQSLPIKRVILYSNGVAHIERRGVINGNAEINLSFKQSQVDDVLKSMIVIDLGEGRIGAVSYNSSAPPSARMAEIPFSVDARSENGDEEGGIAGVLAQLQGAKVTVTSSRGPVSGSVLTVTPREMKSEKGSYLTHFVVIASESGEITSLDLDEVRSIKLLDKDTQKDINEFAGASAMSRRRDAKTITVTSEGTGPRELMISYTISAPIWKTTYRVVMDDEGKPFFQGWAIVDNVSEESWNGVKLSLVSGSPVSFIQTLQKPMYRYRPVVPIPEDLELDPQLYEAEIGYGDGEGSGSGSGSGTGTTSSTFQGARTAGSNVILDGVDSNNMMSAPSTVISNELMNLSAGVETAAKGNEIGDLFEYEVEQPVTVERNRSALIPIIQTKMEGERISIFNQNARSDRPMNGLLLTNTTPLTFEGGSMTVIDGNAYAGEALMERLKSQERRLISYALDLSTVVSVDKKEDREPAKLIKAVDGVFQVHFFKSDSKIYKFKNLSDRKKVVWVEHPIRPGWKLSEKTQKPDILTERYYRFRVELGPFETNSLEVAEQQGLMDVYRLDTFSKEQLALFVERRYIDSATRAKLEKLIELRSRLAEIEMRLESLDDERDEISEDQKRFRENIEALSKTPEAKALIARYIQKAGDQETRIEQLSAQKKSLEAESAGLEEEIRKEIREFRFEQTN